MTLSMEASHLLKTNNKVCLATSESPSAFGLPSGNIRVIQLHSETLIKKKEDPCKFINPTLPLHYETYDARAGQFKEAVHQQNAIWLTRYNALRSQTIKGKHQCNAIIVIIIIIIIIIVVAAVSLNFTKHKLGRCGTSHEARAPSDSHC